MKKCDTGSSRSLYMLRHINAPLSAAPTRQKANASRGNQPLSSLPFHLIYASICVYLLHSEQSSVVLSPWHSPLVHSPGPSCGMLYSARPMEEGHPGTREERKRANTHMLTQSPTHANTYARTNTAVGSHHDPLASFQIKDCVGRPAFRLNEVTKRKRKTSHIFPHMLC